MTITEFEALNAEAQVGCMLMQGVCIAEEVTKLCHKFLFQVASFYVEVYHDLRSSEILGMRTLTGSDQIESYLNSIDITSLLT